jgi:hypothetical protein
MSQKLLLTFYLAAAIEHNKSVLEDNKEDHKELIKKELYNPLIGIYDPVEREGQKMGTTCGQANTTIKNLKKAGAWESFDDRMKHIWWGNINTDVSNKLPIIQAIRNDFIINGNTINDLNEWSDYAAVIRSNFIVAYIEKDVKTVGTYKEIHTAYLLGIPVYLLLPDSTVTEANSTLISMVRDSNGKVFSGKYCTKELIAYLKDKYNI